MHLKMVKGQEHGLVISKKITDPSEFMYPAYRQALDALREIVQQSKKLQHEATNAHGYLHNIITHNIITFSGSRGQGKTSAMVSFSNAMSNSFQTEDLKQDDPLKNCHFTVLPPIDPTILEQNQSILAVILSRMYRLAEQSWAKSCGSQGFSSHYGRSEAEKNELLALFQRCLSGINAIKFRKGKEIQSLAGIHEISDSSLLKEKFYELTSQLLRFTGSGGENQPSYLVIQLDDTDFQIRRGYEILEDIRKYLTIPNLIILMATDMDMLRVTLTQYYVQEFERGLFQNIITIDQLRKIESKYLDKLIPPTYTVYLPHLDEVIHHQGTSLTIKYIDPDADGRNILLNPNNANDKEEDYFFQSLILRYVYRKTRIVFAAPTSYVHNLIPTTLRGFAQFLGTLSSMQDVPEILESKTQKPKIEDVNNPKKLAALVDEQLKILEVNLPLFENYFLNDWVHTKLSVRKAAVLEKLMTANPEERYQLVITQLEELYEKYDPAQTKVPGQVKNNSQLSDEKVASYGEMVGYIQKLRASHRQMDDFYFFFAIHTFFTIQYHKEILRQKRAAITPYLDGKESGLLIFDFFPESAYLPDQYYLPNDTYTVEGQKLADVLDTDQCQFLRERIKNEKVLRCLLTKVDDNHYKFSFMNFARLFLSMDALKSLKLDQASSIQASLYSIQTSAATAAINWDVQNMLSKSLKRVSDRETSTPYFTMALRDALTKIDDDIEAINPQKINKDPMIFNWLTIIHDLMMDVNHRNDLGVILDAVDTVLNPNLFKDLCNIYRAADQLKAAIMENPVNSSKLDLCWSSFVDATKNYNAPKQKNGFQLDVLHIEDLIKDLKTTGSSQDEDIFWREFTRQMGKLCKYYGFTITKVKKALKNEEHR